MQASPQARHLEVLSSVVKWRTVSNYKNYFFRNGLAFSDTTLVRSDEPEQFPMHPPVPDLRTLEIHPVPFTRLLHRYDSSGNRERDGLGVPLLCEAIGDAASLGYNCLHIAGTEPLHCPALHALCSEAHRVGMMATLQLQQREITPRLLDELNGSVDLLGVALDGRPASHGRMRKCHRIRMALDRGIPVVVIFQMGRGSMKDLEWAAHFAAEHGATALAVRASKLSSEQLATAWMVLEYFRDLYRGRLAMGFEAPNRFTLPTEPPDLMGWHYGLSDRPHNLGEIVSPLVIDCDGIVLPLRRDFPAEFALGDLRDHPLLDLARSWIDQQSADFARCYLDALRHAQAGGHRLTDFFDLLSEEAGRSRQAALAAAC
jgi:hypothetical protein